jgi:hypothetical protein
LEIHVDMSGVCATIEDGEGECLVGLVKFVSRTEDMMRKHGGRFLKAHLRVVVIIEIEESLGGRDEDRTE